MMISNQSDSIFELSKFMNIYGSVMLMNIYNVSDEFDASEQRAVLLCCVMSCRF